MSDRPPRFITPQGFAALRAEYEQLFGIERPKIVETVSWAASLGDRSENADYHYGKKRLREIDRRLSHLSKVMKSAKVVDPARQEQRDAVRFGATVELADEDDERRIITLVGEDEADATAGNDQLGSADCPRPGRSQGRRRADRPAAGRREELRNRADQLSG